MLMLYYIRWNGTADELKEYVGRVMTISSEVEGADFKGIFVPSSAWTAVLLIEAASFDNGKDVYSTYMQKYGSHPNITLAKLELLSTFEELGYAQ